MKATIGKKVLPLFLSLLLLLGLMPTVAFAAGIIDGLQYEDNGESVTIINYTGSGGNVTIPAEIEGLPVTTIGDYAFQNCSSLTIIEIPASVTTIGEYAFLNCTNLSSVTFAEESKLTAIGRYAFYYCSSLTSIKIPDNVTTIGDGAFISCTNLSSVTFADESKLTAIGEFAFGNCTNLSSMTFTSKTAPSLEGNDVFTDCSALAAIHVPHGATGYTAANGWPENLVDAGSHTLNHYDAVAPTCTENGTREYWCCPGCEKYFLDETGENMIEDIEEYKVIPATGHDWGEPEWSWSNDGQSVEVSFTCKNDSSHVEKPTVSINSTEKTPATCTEAGTTTYRAKVTFNGQEYASFKDVDDIDPLGHKVKKVDGNAPTATEPGNIEYWYCPQCDTYFKDADLTEVITKEQTVLAPTGEAEPSKPEESTPDKPDSDIPQTGDSSDLALWFTLMGVGAAGLCGALFLQKRRESKVK